MEDLDQSSFDSLTLALEGWFDKPLSDLPEALRQRVEKEIFHMPWDGVSAESRRRVALDLDYQRDPATEQDQQFWWDFFERMESIKKKITEWEMAATPTAGEMALKEARLAELRQELARMEVQQRQSRGDYHPKRSVADAKGEAASASQGPPVQYVAYPKAMHQLAEKLDATPEELAAWVWFGPETGGIAAYLNANELDPPPRFHYLTGADDQDYLAPLMGCWFRADDLARFEPSERYITGATLIGRWGRKPGMHPESFIRAKIAESRLEDFHPIYGGTLATFPEHPDFPPLTSGLFPLSQVEQIEAEDFPEHALSPEADRAEPRKSVATGSSSHEVPRTAVRTTARREVRKLDTQNMYKRWQKEYRDLRKKWPNKSDIWYSLQIAKLDIAKGRDAETIRKHMKP